MVVAPDAGTPTGRIGWPDLGESWALEVRVAGADPRFSPVLGRTRDGAGGPVFEPRFPLEPGVTYTVTARGPEGEERRGRVQLPPRELVSTTTVVAVYPSNAEPLPANLLKFYVEFSAPMRRGEAHRHVRLLGERGEVLEDVLLEVRPELWDPQTRRLTLLFDPGRIKRGVGPREAVGPTLLPDRRYALQLLPGWRDARGAPLVEGLRVDFRTGPEDRRSPEVDRWILVAPTAGTRDPLRVTFDEPLDHALLEHSLTLRGLDGRPLDGIGRSGSGERTWSWIPRDPWRPGEHVLLVDPRLEDRAGNSIDRTFESALGNGSAGPAASIPVALRFSVPAAGEGV